MARSRLPSESSRNCWAVAGLLPVMPVNCATESSMLDGNRIEILEESRDLNESLRREGRTLGWLTKVLWRGQATELVMA